MTLTFVTSVTHNTSVTPNMCHTVSQCDTKKFEIARKNAKNAKILLIKKKFDVSHNDTLTRL
jgi:hypothetical protein